MAKAKFTAAKTPTYQNLSRFAQEISQKESHQKKGKKGQVFRLDVLIYFDDTLLSSHFVELDSAEVVCEPPAPDTQPGQGAGTRSAGEQSV